jgi:hypothetical protein
MDVGRVNTCQNTKRLKTAFKLKLGGYAKMNANQIIRHLEDLKKEAEGHFTDDGDDEIFHQDAEALQAAIDAVKRNEIIADAINSEIAICNHEIRKVDIEKAKTEERRMNYGDRKVMLVELFRTIKGGEE